MRVYKHWTVFSHFVVTQYSKSSGADLEWSLVKNELAAVGWSGYTG